MYVFYPRPLTSLGGGEISFPHDAPTLPAGIKRYPSMASTAVVLRPMKRMDDPPD